MEDVHVQWKKKFEASQRLNSREREEASGACNAKVFKQLKMNIKSMNKEQVALDSFVGKRETPNGVGETMLLVGTRACVFRAYQE